MKEKIKNFQPRSARSFMLKLRVPPCPPWLNILCVLILITFPLLTSCDNGDNGGGGGEDPVSYTVTFDTDGGTSVQEQTVASGALVSRPSNPVKAGKSFDAWYKEDKSTKWNFNADPVTSKITLYAKWNDVPAGSFTVTFNSNGGTVIEDQVIESGKLVTRPASVTKPNAFFGGWYKEAACTNLWVFPSDKVTQAATLYAKWTDAQPAKVTITINEDKEGSALKTIQINYNSALPASYFGAGADVPSNKTGYRFTGWRDGARPNVTITQTAPRFLADADLTAQWAWQVAVKFELGVIETHDADGELTGDTVTVAGAPPADVFIDNNTAMGSKYPQTPTLDAEFADDYQFAGWFNGDTQYDATDRITVVEPISEFTLTAKWSFIDKTIRTQNPAIHPGNHFVEIGIPDGILNLTVNQSYEVSGLFANVEPGAGVLSAIWYRATEEDGEGTQVGTQTAAGEENPHLISLRYTVTEPAAGTFWYWVEVTNTNVNATPGFQTNTSKTQNRLKVVVTGP
jgi:uncharacterized repeat protein (TIGR02543 family)